MGIPQMRRRSNPQHHCPSTHPSRFRSGIRAPKLPTSLSIRASITAKEHEIENRAAVDQPRVTSVKIVSPKP
uniref:Uncharacterized protein n=1 Tax=Kalanchoe fedtschenkoi TaxID=63787 RepID=A0A7N0VI52_KALFE